MEFSAKPPSDGIKAKWGRLVKVAIGSVAALAALIVALGQPAPADLRNGFAVQDTDAFPIPVRDEELNNIEARSYEIRVVRLAGSGRSYLFEDPASAKPMVGRILLLKRDDEPIMAFRVLRTYPQERQFIARRVRRYSNHESLGEGQRYIALERIAEVGLPADVGYATEDERDIEELQKAMLGGGLSQIQPAQGAGGGDFFRSDELPPQLRRTEEERRKEDAEKASPPPKGSDDPALEEASLEDLGAGTALLDEGGEPIPKPAPARRSSDAGGESDPFAKAEKSRKPSWSDSEAGTHRSQFWVDDDEPHEYAGNSLTWHLGMIRNTNADGKLQFYTATGLRFGSTLGRQVLLQGNRIQDSFVLEGGAFLYRINGYDVEDDSYTVLPLAATLRYTVMPRESYAFFIYGGAYKNLVLSASTPASTDPASLTQEEAKALLGRFLPAFGAGAIVRLGPGWELRADAGIDLVALGLSLRF